MSPDERDPAEILARTAVALGLSEHERRGKPESVQPRHYADARVVLEALSSGLHVQGMGARADLLNRASRLLTDAAYAPGPDTDGEADDA